MRVLCIDGYTGILEEGETYTVIEQTEGGNYMLAEVNPPPPYASFKSSRFVPIRDLEDVVEVEDLEIDSDL